MKALHVEGRRWFDSSGNTYHTTRSTVDGEAQPATPMEYGYEDEYLWTARRSLAAAGLLPGLEDSEPLWRYCQRNGIIFTHCAIDGRGKDLH